MLNFSNKELAQKHLVQGIKVLNVFALRAWVQVYQSLGPGPSPDFRCSSR